jgi:crossover junction endodeoxyribonuclease RusA
MMCLPYPVPLNRAYRNFRGIVVLSKEGKDWKRYAALQAQASGMRPITGAVAVSVILHPKTKKDGAASKVRCDLDGIFKLLFDALNGVAWIDDKQVEKLSAEVGCQVEGGGLSVVITAIREG